ncbi:MAG: hypothetical protein RML75_10220 [Cyanobacteriota bacterium SKYGB_h_bin112]|nr:hypothetical protein [Cyanobacteriota bacterium SKYGB_h_bin112]
MTWKPLIWKLLVWDDGSMVSSLTIAQDYATSDVRVQRSSSRAPRATTKRNQMGSFDPAFESAEGYTMYLCLSEVTQIEQVKQSLD